MVGGKIPRKRTHLARAALALIVLLAGLLGPGASLAEEPTTPTAAESASAPQSGVADLAVAESLTSSSWPMVAANPQRTSWNAVEVRGALNPIWYRVIEAYIPPKVQVIAAGGLL